MDFTGIIPARYASGRMPGKPLALIGGKPMVQWVYEHVSEALGRAIVATDDTRVVEAVAAFGGRAVLTGNHPHGTARVYEAFTLSGIDADVVVNCQGDEPLLAATDIRALAEACAASGEISTLVHPVDNGDTDLYDPNAVKTALSADGHALDFSRDIIPGYSNLIHIGIYAFPAQLLREAALMPQSKSAIDRRLEQMSWLDAGYPIRAVVTQTATIGIDTPADLIKAENFIMSKL